MSGGGLSEARPKRTHDAMAAYVQRGHVPVALENVGEQESPELASAEAYGTGVVSPVYRPSGEGGS